MALKDCLKSSQVSKLTFPHSLLMRLRGQERLLFMNLMFQVKPQERKLVCPVLKLLLLQDVILIAQILLLQNIRLK